MIKNVQSPNVSTQPAAAKQKTNVSKPVKSPEQIKEGRKKLALALGALGAAGVGIVIAAKSGKLNSLKKPKDIAAKTETKVNEIVLKKSKRFTPTSSSYVTKTSTDGKSQTFLKEIGTISNPNFRNGETITISKLTDLSTGKLASVKEIEKRCDIPSDIIELGNETIKKGHTVLPNGKKVACTYSVDNYGRNPKLRSILEGQYDKKTGLLTQTERFCKLDNGRIKFLEDTPIRTTITNKKTGNQLYAKFLNGKIKSDTSYITGTQKGFRFDKYYPDSECCLQGIPSNRITDVKNWAQEIDDNELKKVFIEKFHI